MPTNTPIAELELQAPGSAGAATEEIARSASPYEFRSIGRDNPEQLCGARRDRGATETALREASEAARRAFEEGRREGERAARSESETAITVAVMRERTQLSSALGSFREQRDSYFAAAEQEVVKLSLAIAARILHREAQLDPLLLSGAVRVALDKLADRTSVTLRVPANQASAWQKIFEPVESADQPTITGDPSLAAGDCILDTHMGSVELGVAAQLGEIERGFFDLINLKPVS